jgi:copper chaperone
METLKFKTNIKCAGCVATVTPYLEDINGVKGNWEVDIVNPEKTLTVKADKAKAEEIKQALRKAGYKAEEA